MKKTFSRPVNRSSRRSFFKSAVVGTAGLAGVAGVVGAGVYISESSHKTAAHAAGYDQGPYVYQNGYNGNGNGNGMVNGESVQNILNMAATAEALGVTFYTQILQNADMLGLQQSSRKNLQAALIEEQIHLLFLKLNGAKLQTKHFSFPFGMNTMQDLNMFLKTQQMLESIFIAAYLTAVKEFAMLGRPDLAQVAAQIGGVEAEHRAIGRVIGGMTPANNLAFEQLAFNRVGDAMTALNHHGFLNPTGNNGFWYQQLNNMNGINWNDMNMQNWQSWQNWQMMPTMQMTVQPMHF